MCIYINVRTFASNIDKMMKKTSIIGLFTVIFLLSAACGKRQLTRQNVRNSAGEPVSLHYATGFTVKCLPDGVRLVDVKPQKSSKKRRREDVPALCRFALVPKGIIPSSLPRGYEVIHVPVDRCVTTNTLQLSNFICLDALNKLSGISSTRSMFNKKVHRLLDNGKIVGIGKEGNFELEKIFAARPDVIFISPFKNGGYTDIQHAGITLIPHFGSMEESPLGQAEWIKYVAMFVGKEYEADSIFRGIEQRYLAAAQLAKQVKTKPTVMSGEMKSGSWFAVGGRNHLAQIIRDAGGQYVLESDGHVDGVPMEFEEIYVKAAHADYWRIANNYKGAAFTYETLAAAEPRNKDFKAWKQRHVIYCNRLETPYYEDAPVEPDVLLKDFIAILHPEVIKGYHPKYYRLLK